MVKNGEETAKKEGRRQEMSYLFYWERGQDWFCFCC